MSYPQIAVPNTQHSVFYSYAISINGLEIGSFEKFDTSSDRSTELIREVLFSRGPQVKEIVWGGTDITVNISRVEMYRTSLLEALGFEIFTLEDFNQPVDIVELQTLPAGGGKRSITYLDCVAKSMGKSVDTGTVRIVETMTFACRTIIGERF